MKVYLIGNSLVKEDNLPIRLKPDIKKAFPDLEFIEVDPTENFIPEENSIIIDTIQGLKEITVFNSLQDFSDHKLISPHDYDLGLHLKLLQKLGKISTINLIGIPQIKSSETEISNVLHQLSHYLKNFMLSCTVT